MKFQRKEYNGNFINIYETQQIILGFTEIHFPFQDLSRWFSSYRLMELKQVHSDIIHFSSEIKSGCEGDGIILDQRNTMAVIKTADCTPLFFWHQGNSNCTVGGVLHIGWRGLLKGIEKKLPELLAKKFINFDIQQLNIFLGPSIEKKCYEVGYDLYEMFSPKSYKDEIFFPYSGTGNKSKYLLDVKKGIRLSLKESGIPDHRIWECPLCTFCEISRFPSYRRCPVPGNRIYNFLLIKQAKK